MTSEIIFLYTWLCKMLLLLFCPTCILSHTHMRQQPVPYTYMDFSYEYVRMYMVVNILNLEWYTHEMLLYPSNGGKN